MKRTPDSAKQFLLSKLSTQATHDDVILDEIEKTMFVFSESSGTVDGLFTGSVRHALSAPMFPGQNQRRGGQESSARDKRTKEGKSEWSDALKALSNEDFYGLVMIDQAGIPRKDDGLWRFELEWLPFELIELAVIVLGFLVVFKPSVLGLSLPDWVRWLAYPMFVWLVWYIGRVFYNMQMAKAIRRSKPSSH